MDSTMVVVGATQYKIFTEVFSAIAAKDEGVGVPGWLFALSHSRVQARSPATNKPVVAVTYFFLPPNIRL
jgi:hypothetical protein